MEATHDKAISPFNIILAFAAVSIGYFFVSTYNAAFRGPLAKIPGPASRHLSVFPYIQDLISGRSVQSTVALHKKYGDVVRLAPNEVSFTSGETAWPDIYGFRTGKLKGHVNMQKDPQWYGPPANGVPSIILADDVNHTRGRKVLSHAFSERSLSAQEPLLQDYVDQFISRLKETTSANSEAVNMVKWYNWTTFDIIADLVFGEPFGCLQNMETHEYVELLFSSLSAAMWFSIFQYLPLVKTFKRFLVDSKILGDRVRYSQWIATKVAARAAREEKPDRPDLMTDILANNGAKGAKLSDLEMNSNASLLITAGSETTATFLSGATYLLLRNPDKMAKLQEEVRSTFSSYDEINLEAVNRLPYTNAVITESLRVFPPVPVGFVRQVGAGGEVISGHYIPEGTAVSVSQYAANHSEANFVDAEKFIPERWLENSNYASDKKSVLQPFSFGPRGCLGRSLANAEMRLILAKTIWSFDMQLEDRSRNWIDECTVMRLWIKPELAVKLTQVERK